MDQQTGHQNPADASPGNNAGKTRARGRPFAKGNAGRPRGARGRVAKIVREIEKDLPAIKEVLLSKARQGHVAAAVALLRCSIGPARERDMPIKFALPPLRTAADAMKAIAAIAECVAAGELDGDAAKILVALVAEFRSTLSAVEHEGRIEAIEARLREATR